MIRLNGDEKSTKIAGILRESRDVFDSFTWANLQSYDS